MTRKQVPARLRLRRRLLLASTPVAVAALVVAAKLISVVVVGDSAREHFAAGDIGALRSDVSILGLLNVIEPANADVAAGGLAVLEDRIDSADAKFSAALEETDAARSCPVRVNLELVRERQGDIDAWEARLDAARARYESALAVMADAPEGCFAGNDDPDPQRRGIRQDAAVRVNAKISALGTVAPPAVAPPPPVAAPAPAASPPPAPEAIEAPDVRRLDPSDTEPLDALRQLLRDAANG